MRDYAWPKSVAEDEYFRFGASEIEAPGARGQGVKNALGGDPEHTGGCGAKTRITNRQAENYRRVADDQLGASKNLMQNQRNVPGGHTYGMKTTADVTSAG